MLISRTLWWILAVGMPFLALGAANFFRGKPTSARNAAGALGSLAGVAAAVYLWFFSPEVLVGREHDGRIQVARMKALGHPSFHGERVGEGDFELWVVNDTSAEMVAAQVAHGNAQRFDPVRIPAGSVAGVKFEVQHIGPEDQPPVRQESGSVGESRGWLTWNRL